jgi:hypothetical protein
LTAGTGQFRESRGRDSALFAYFFELRARFHCYVQLREI